MSATAAAAAAEIDVVELSCRNAAAECAKVVEEIVRIEKKIFPKHESLSSTFDDELRKKNAGLLYARVGTEVAGYVMFSWPTSLSASVTKLAVKEKYRRRGYGEALLKAAIQKCRTRNVLRVTLHVDPSRSPALTLYKKLGFETDCLVEKYYSSNRDALRMYLEFNRE